MAERTAPPEFIQRQAALRADNWWLVPWVTAIVYTLFVLYSVARGFDNTNYHWGPYLSPFFSIPLTIAGIPLSAAFYNGIFPLGFRATCYYYRKSYYRAFFWNPPACAVPGRTGGYRGETVFPLILNNLHRFFFYAAVAVVLVLWYDVTHAFWWDDRVGIGVGTVWMTVNVALLSLYTFSCHSFRHLVGGNVDCYSCAAAGPTRHGWWASVSGLNKRHGLYAWLSLFSVWSTDVYIRLVAAGAIADLRII
jgi:hypothetical protein